MCWHCIYVLVNKNIREQNGVAKLMLFLKNGQSVNANVQVEIGVALLFVIFTYIFVIL